MKKKYTRKQIQEAISYWTKRLRKMNESDEFEYAKEEIEQALAARDDIPNYIKNYIHDTALDNIGTDGLGYEWDVDLDAKSLLKDRRLTVSAVWAGGAFDKTGIAVTGLPFKFSFGDLDARLRQMFPDHKDIYASGVEIDFPGERISFYAECSGCFDDLEWRKVVSRDGTWPIVLDDNGDASRVHVPGSNEVSTINDRYELT